MGSPAPWPSSLLYCSLAKHCLSGCATWDHVCYEIASVWAQHQGRKVRAEEENRTEGCASFLALVQMCCASNDAFSPLPCWEQCLWKGRCGFRDIWSSWGPGSMGKVGAMGKWTATPEELSSSSKAADFPFHMAADTICAFPFANCKTNRETNKHWGFCWFSVQQIPIFQ